VVYVDNDPLVLAHARGLLNSSPEGATDYVDSDVENPVCFSVALLGFSQTFLAAFAGVSGVGASCERLDMKARHSAPCNSDHRLNGDPLPRRRVSVSGPQARRLESRPPRCTRAHR
jgi:hypothetical protein